MKNDGYECPPTVDQLVDDLRRQVRSLQGENDGLRRAALAADRAPLRPSFQALALAETIPGWIEQFKVEVPASHRTDTGVRCECGDVAVAPGEMEGCPCGRYFLHTGERILVARPEEPA